MQPPSQDKPTLNDFLAHAFPEEVTAPKTHEHAYHSAISSKRKIGMMMGGVAVALLVVGISASVLLSNGSTELRQQASVVYNTCLAGVGADTISCPVGVSAGTTCKTVSGVGTCENTDTNPACTCILKSTATPSPYILPSPAQKTCNSSSAHQCVNLPVTSVCLTDASQKGTCVDGGTGSCTCSGGTSPTPISKPSSTPTSKPSITPIRTPTPKSLPTATPRPADLCSTLSWDNCAGKVPTGSFVCTAASSGLTGKCVVGDPGNMTCFCQPSAQVTAEPPKLCYRYMGTSIGCQQVYMSVPNPLQQCYPALDTFNTSAECEAYKNYMVAGCEANTCVNNQWCGNDNLLVNPSISCGYGVTCTSGTEKVLEFYCDSNGNKCIGGKMYPNSGSCPYLAPTSPVRPTATTSQSLIVVKPSPLPTSARVVLTSTPAVVASFTCTPGLTSRCEAGSLVTCASTGTSEVRTPCQSGQCAADGRNCLPAILPTSSVSTSTPTPRPTPVLQPGYTCNEPGHVGELCHYSVFFYVFRFGPYCQQSTLCQ